ncbi:MAG: nuclease-related domain-containing protein [Planctomycetaceae bacterium]
MFAIETKTRSKPSGDSTVSFDGHAILIASHKPDRDPIVQSTAAAKALQGKLLEYSRTKVSVRPVVLFPGWFVEKQPRDANVWVLNEKAFVKWIGQEPDRLSRETSFQLAAALGRYVRDREANAS